MNETKDPYRIVPEELSSPIVNRIITDYSFANYYNERYFVFVKDHSKRDAMFFGISRNRHKVIVYDMQPLNQGYLMDGENLNNSNEIGLYIESILKRNIRQNTDNGRKIELTSLDDFTPGYYWTFFSERIYDELKKMVSQREVKVGSLNLLKLMGNEELKRLINPSE